MFIAESTRGTANLGQVPIVGLVTGLLAGEVVALPIRVQTGKQTTAGNGLADAMKARYLSLMGTTEHDDALVNHHARKRHAFAFDAVFAPDFASLDHTGTLKHALDPALAARARKLGLVLAVKVRHVPARKAALVQLHNVIDLDPTGTAFGYLAQPLVQQPLQSISLEAFNEAAKAALALAQYQGGLSPGSDDPRSSHRRLLEISSFRFSCT